MVDNRQVMKLLRSYPNEVRVPGIRAAAKKALKPVVKSSRTELESKRSEWGTRNKDAFPHFDFVKRYIKSLSFKDKKNPGAFVTVKGPLVPVGTREWPLKNFAMLLAKGAYGRSTRGGANRGDFEGIGDFIQEGFNKNKVFVMSAFKSNLLNELVKAKERIIRRIQRRGAKN